MMGLSPDTFILLVLQIAAGLVSYGAIKSDLKNTRAMAKDAKDKIESHTTDHLRGVFDRRHSSTNAKT